MKHTPAPWTAEKSYKNATDQLLYLYTISSESEEGGWIADITDTCDGKTEANARLIAAAPELLEACKLAEIALGDFLKENYPVKSVIRELREAIAKATA